MTEGELTISGGFVGLNEDQIRRKMEVLADKLAESAQDAVHAAFGRSVDLSSFVGRQMDPEAVRAILRGLKVEVVPGWPPQLEAKFHDDIGHLYGFEDLPDSIAKMLQEIVDQALEEWSNSDAIGMALKEVLESEEP